MILLRSEATKAIACALDDYKTLDRYDMRTVLDPFKHELQM